MTVLTAWCRHEVRSRWRSLLVLVLLVAFSTGTVATAVAGARRGRTAFDRLRAISLPADAAVLPNEPGFDWEQVRALPGVAALTEFVVTSYGIDEIPSEHWDVGGFPPADDDVWQTIEQPVVLEGRRPDPIRDDEVVISPTFEHTFGVHVGDSLTLLLFTPEQIQVSDTGGDPGEPGGPRISATVVGVILSPWFSDGSDSPNGFVVPSPGLYRMHPDELAGPGESVNPINALVRLDDGAAGLPAFQKRLAEVTGRDDIDVWDRSENVSHTNRVTGFEANSLLAFALVAAIASFVLIGQALTRYVRTTTVDLDAFVALGLPRSASRSLAVLGPVTAGVLGTTIGLAGAAFASDRFPIGTAAAYEPRPGRHVDWIVAGVTMAVVPLLLAAASRFGARRGSGRTSPVPTGVRQLATRLPIPVTIGVHLAFDRGRGRSRVPVRPTMAGAVLGVAGVVGALTFSAGVHDATAGYGRFGQTFELGAYFGYNGFDFTPAAQALDVVRADPDVRGVIDAPMDVAQIGDHSVSVYAFEPIGDPIDVVLLHGRLPNRTDEIALAPRSAQAMGASVGDRITVRGATGTEEATVTGLAFVPAGPHNDYASGGWMTGDGYRRLFDGFKFHFGLADTADGADLDTVIGRLADQGVFIDRAPISPPSERAELSQIEVLPLWLAGFLALLAIGALAHTIASTGRLRRGDLMVLRALGLTGGQSRRMLFTQSTLIALVGFVIGIPLGVVSGRAVWRVVAEGTPVQLVVPTAWTVVALTPLVAVLVANLLAVWPGRRVARQRIGEVLRAE